MQALLTLYDIVAMLVNVFVILIIVQFVIGLLFAFNVVNPGNQFLSQVYQSINALLEPLLAPIRRRMPATGAIDFSPLVLLILAQILLIVLESIIRSAV